MLWASYFDLGIMHQTVHNTYQSLKTLDASRFLELTDPHGSGMQIKRMAIHNDILLALLAPLYAIYNGPETLLIVQALFTASGGIALHLIARENIKEKGKKKFVNRLSVLVPLLFFLYVPIQKANLYEFHAVTLATPLVLWMVYFVQTKKWTLVTVSIITLLLTKEQVGLSIGVFLFIEALRRYDVVAVFNKRRFIPPKADVVRLLLISFLSVLFVFVVVFLFMPLFRDGQDHFALNYYVQSSNNNSGNDVFFTLSRFFSHSTVVYLHQILGPLLYTPLLSISTVPAIPEILVNTLSKSANMRNLYYHYTALISPWLFIGVIQFLHVLGKRVRRMSIVYLLLGAITVMSIVSFVITSPFPTNVKKARALFEKLSVDRQEALKWQKVFASDSIKVSSTGQFAPYFAGRRYFYDFGKQYVKADYVILRRREVFDYPEKDILTPIYLKLANDVRFEMIYQKGEVEVYKKVQ